MGKLESYSRDVIKLTLQFMGVAFCSIPATVAYFLALRGGAGSVLARALSLGLGAILAYFVWRFLGKRIWHSGQVRASDILVSNYGHATDGLIVVGFARLTGTGTIAAAAAFTFVQCTSQPPMTLHSSSESIAEGKIIFANITNGAP